VGSSGREYTLEIKKIVVYIVNYRPDISRTKEAGGSYERKNEVGGPSGWELDPISLPEEGQEGRN